MSFLSRRPSRSGNREGDAGRDDEYDDYDYAPDGYRGDEDENWSPGEYFSPEGIKGRWADGQRPASARPPAAGAVNPDGAMPGAATPAGATVGATTTPAATPGPGTRTGPTRPAMTTTVTAVTGRAAATAPTSTPPAPTTCPRAPTRSAAERGGRRRKERGERGSRLRIGRRDRGEEIWPDDGVSDEDYWASVASDRPLPGGHQPLEAELPAAADSRPTGRPAGRGGSEDLRGGAGSRPGADPRATGDQRFGDEQRSATSSAA